MNDVDTPSDGWRADAVLPLDALTALSPIDGRYAARTAPLRGLFSEFALIRERVRVEILWFVHLADEPGVGELPTLAPRARRALLALAESFSLEDATAVKAIERRTNHDVKAVEYFIRERLDALEDDADAGADDAAATPRDARGTVAAEDGDRGSLVAHGEFVHFACTSEDINNLAWGRLLARWRDEWLLERCEALERALATLARESADVAMLSRTHGQTASPTTLGKEIANVVHRVRRQRRALERVEILGKINGAVGNYNAHVVAYPEVDWPDVAARFVDGCGLVFNSHTTQIEPHDCIAELFDAAARLDTVLIDLCRDVWGYISLGYLTQRAVPGEVGSSTMPHKVNPIDFENAEGNFGLANAVFGHLGAKLPISRWQRDLSDSTALRNLGVGAAYMEIGIASLLKGLGKLGVGERAIAEDLDAAWEVLAEPVQTLLRRHGVGGAYETLKALTRGRTIDERAMREFVAALDLPSDARSRLERLSPASYTGLAARLAREL